MQCPTGAHWFLSEGIAASPATSGGTRGMRVSPTGPSGKVVGEGDWVPLFRWPPIELTELLTRTERSEGKGGSGDSCCVVKRARLRARVQTLHSPYALNLGPNPLKPKP